MSYDQVILQGQMILFFKRAYNECRYTLKMKNFRSEFQLNMTLNGCGTTSGNLVLLFKIGKIK